MDRVISVEQNRVQYKAMVLVRTVLPRLSCYQYHIPTSTEVASVAFLGYPVRTFRCPQCSQWIVTLETKTGYFILFILLKLAVNHAFPNVVIALA